MAQVTPVQIIAEGRVAVAGGVPSFTWVRGANSIADTGAGIVTITLDDPADATSPGTATFATPTTTANGFFVTSIRPADTTVAFYVWSATGAAADNVGFDFLVLQAPTTNT